MPKPKSDRKTFTAAKPSWVEFEIGPDVFKIAAKLPAGAVDDILAMIATEDITEQWPHIATFLDTVMETESRKVFAARLHDAENPIDLDVIGEVVKWMVEMYGGRPTMPLSGSPNGLGGDGMSSTDGAPAKDSTPAISPSIAS